MIEFNSTAAVAYSFDTNSLPPTSIELQYKPCMKPNEQSVDTENKQKFYGSEMQQGGCTENSFLDETYDPRYTSSGIYSNI